MPDSCYIHIPFCSGNNGKYKGCKYCSFVSFNNLAWIPAYVNALVKEISTYYKGESLQTLYLGGGTPSLIPLNLLEKIVKQFSLAENAEITIEANPENLNYNYLKGLTEIGFNRLSAGTQTFDDELLHDIGRRHNSNQSVQSVIDAKKAGFKNINLDLIYGLPNQTLNKIKRDLSILLELDIQHISTYGLKIEGGSYWGEFPPKNVPDDDMQAEMYEFINRILADANFVRYEVSNFAKKGYESKHNLTYWNNSEYYGFGVSAHGYVNGVRYSNYCTIEKYIKNPVEREFSRTVSRKEMLEEEIFLGFRKTEGIDTAKINRRFNITFEEKYKTILQKFEDYIIKTEKGYAFNLKGTMLSNEILPYFLES